MGRKLRVELADVSTLEGILTAADDQEFTLEWKQREPKPVGKGKVTVTKQKSLSYKEINNAKVLVK
jgi:ribosome maturation factor RimP